MLDLNRPSQPRLSNLPGGYFDSRHLWRNAAGNISGQIAGLGIGNAFIYGNGTYTSIGVLGDYQDYATSINSGGQVVGYLTTGEYTAGTAFIYSDGTLATLNSLMTGSGWSFDQASGINDLGQIVGTGENPSGQTDAFLLTPVVPEPATVSVLAAGVLGLWMRRRK